MTDDIKAIRDALAGVKPAQWMHLFGDRFVYDRMEDGCRGLPMAGVDYGPPTLEESKRLDYIAAVHPERIARLLDALEAAQKDAAIVRAQALEEAALLCDARAKEMWGFTEEEHASKACAAAIRAMKE